MSNDYTECHVTVPIDDLATGCPEAFSQKGAFNYY